MKTNRGELQIKVVFSSSCQDMLKGLRYRDHFLLIVFIIIAIIIIIIIITIIIIIIIIITVFYLTSVKIHINDNTN